MVESLWVESKGWEEGKELSYKEGKIGDKRKKNARQLIQIKCLTYARPSHIVTSFNPQNNPIVTKFIVAIG